MDLPLSPPLAPMLAAPATTIPPGMAYEPKWDGFRALVFRDHDEVRLISRSGRDLTPYFPDVVEAVRADAPQRCVLDGELVVIDGDALRFTRLLERSGAAPHRVAQLVRLRPASMIVFDVLAVDDLAMLRLPYRERRRVAEALFADLSGPLFLSPMTTDPDTAREWFARFEGNGLDGVIAKSPDGPYLPGVRAMTKIKHRRDADTVIGGFRLHKNSAPGRPLLGVLHLGLHDERGRLAWVGACSGFSRDARERLLEVLLPLALTPGTPAHAEHPWAPPTLPGDARRPQPGPRSGGPDEATYLLAPVLVCEVSYDHLEDDLRFRSSPAFVRFRPDRLPAECTFAQLEARPSIDLRSVLGAGPVTRS